MIDWAGADRQDVRVLQLLLPSRAVRGNALRRAAPSRLWLHSLSAEALRTTQVRHLIRSVCTAAAP